MPLSHRLARREDLPEIVSIYNATIPSRMATADTEPVTVAARVSWFEEHAPHSRPLWVAENEGVIAGWLGFSSFYGRPAYNKTAELSLYVHQSFRRRGVAGYLLEKALAHASSLGVDTVLGFVFAHNIPSLALFGKFGFARWGELPGVALLDGVERDLIILGRRV
jgi:L-amino acid N-acyltransferase YncA